MNALRGMGHRGNPAGAYTYFQHFKPMARIGYSIYIYHLDRDEFNRVREIIGHPPLAE